jgi:hypothetical protein
MPHHDSIVIGMSAGGLDASMAIIRALPNEFPAALFGETRCAERANSGDMARQLQIRQQESPRKKVVNT